LRQLVRKGIFVLVMVAVGVPSAGALAAQQATSSEEAACRPDVRRYCRGLSPDPSVVLPCLQSNRARLSKACQNVLRSHGV
jgi:hypothetical protein